MKTIFVGCNPTGINSDVPFVGTRSGKTLEQWIEAMGLAEEDCILMNLTKYKAVRQSMIKKKDVDLEQFEYELLRNFVYGDRRGVKVVALGKMAAWGLRNLTIPVWFFELPHPSGLNRVLNDKDFMERKLSQCKEWLNEDT